VGGVPLTKRARPKKKRAKEIRRACTSAPISLQKKRAEEGKKKYHTGAVPSFVRRRKRSQSNQTLEPAGKRPSISGRVLKKFRETGGGPLPRTGGDRINRGTI